MIGYVTVEEQVDADFYRALRKASLRRWRNRLRGGSARDRLPAFDDAKCALTRWSQAYRGIRTVEVGQIAGSVGRCRDFDASFLPLKASMCERWSRVDRAYHRGVGLPAVSLYKIGEAYFVRDGNHRVSVARYHGVAEIDAEVTELRGFTSTDAPGPMPPVPDLPPGGDQGEASREEQEMCRPMPKHAPLLGLLAALLVLAVGACALDDGRQETEARTLPDYRRVLSAGEYRSEEFEPSLSLEIGEGWSNEPPEMSDILLLTRGEQIGLGFANAREVYGQSKASAIRVEPAPEDMVGWFARHPYLRASEPEPVVVGGVEGEGFDVVVDDLPKNYYGVCGRGCVATLKFSDGTRLEHREGNKARLIVLEDVGGESVTIGYAGPTARFEEFAPEAQRVIRTVEWESP